MTTPRLIRFNDTQKPMDVISDRRDNPHVFDFPFIPWLLPFIFHSLSSRFRHDSGMPPQSQKKKCHTTDSSLTIYVHMYAYIHMFIHWHNALDQKCFSCSFPFLCQSRRVTLGERGWKSGNVKEKEYVEKRNKDLSRKREKDVNQVDLKNNAIVGNAGKYR